MDMSFDRLVGVGGLVLGVLGIIIGVGVAIAMDPKSKGELFFSISCFVFSGLVLTLTVGTWAFLSDSSTLKRIVISTPLFAAICLSMVEASRWAHDRYEREAPKILDLPVRPSLSLALPAEAPPPKENSPSNDVERERLRIEREQLALNYAPSVYVLYQDGRVEVHNNGRTNITLWGGTYGDIPAVIEKEPRIIVPGTYYYIFAQEIEKRMLELLKNDQQGFTPCHVFIKTQDSKKHTVKSLIVADRKDGAVSIHVQNLEIVDGWIDSKSQRHSQRPAPTNRSNTVRSPLDTLLETNKHLPQVDRENLAESLIEFSALFRQGNELWGKVNAEGGALSHSWGGELNDDSNVDAHIKKLLKLKQMAEEFRERFRKLREKWHYFEPQIDYILGDDPENLGPNSLMNAADDYRAYLESWKTIANKGGRNTTMFQDTQNQYETYTRNFSLWLQASEDRLRQIHDSLV